MNKKGYIDPGSGLPFFSWGAALIGLFFSFLGGALVFLKKFFMNRKFLIFVVLIILIICIIALWRQTMYKEHKLKKIVIIGMDGLDPQLIEKFMEAGKLPHFERLKRIGVYSKLKTIMPPESEVVWTSFFTGLNPGKHGIFDFIMRNPHNYLPYLSLYETSKPKFFKIGSIKIPLLPQRIKRKYKGTPFWEITSHHKIPTYVFFCPNTFPPDKVYGKMISGMGVPDIRGTMGTFSFYTTKKLEKKKDIGGLCFQVKPYGDVIYTYLYGPRNTSKVPPQDVKIPLKIKIDKNTESVLIEIQNTQLLLRKGEHSKWVRVSFKIGLFQRVYGICKFYLKSVSPDLELYCSPVNFDPSASFFPLSFPKDYIKKLSREIGLFYTQGIPYPTWALNESRIDERVFLEIADSILKEKEEILMKELKSFKGGVFFFYFEYPDIIQHMFWRFQDKNHPNYDEEKAKKFGDVILKCYQKMDEILGIVLENISEDTLLIVLSDHGFGPFYKAVHLNSWLRDNGFLSLREGVESESFFENIDWSKTQAYALGLSGIYINQKGREVEGIVTEVQKELIKKKIREGLENWYDQNGEKIVERVYFREEVFKGPYIEEAPDLIIGFNRGYRISWQTALGGVSKNLIENNLRPWSGSHIFCADLIPGILFVNKKVSFNKDPSIIDIIPTILENLGIKVTDRDGKFLFKIDS